MAFENVRLQEPNFVRVDGYFYHITEEADNLFKITDDGTVAFSYPLDTDIENAVQSLEYDGYYFWTLENPTGNDIILRKWEIEDFVAKQIRRYLIDGSASQQFDSNSFTVEHFDRTFQSAASSTQDTIHLGDVSRISPGNRAVLGPSSFPGDEGESELLIVLQTISGTHVQFTTPLTNSYNPGDPVSIATRCWIFNKFRPGDSDPINGSGQLYSFDIFDAVTFLNARDASNIYRDVRASTFLTDPVDSRDYLVFMSQTNLLFLETEQTDPDFLTIVKSATQNNQEVDTTVIPVYEITHENSTLFRLQDKATFKIGASTSTEDWSEFNYQLSTLTRLPQSISLVAVSGIISADGVSETDITATVRDQFDEPLASRTVDFSDDDTAGASPGFVNPTSAVTNAEGKATTTYRAGTEPNVVTITSST